MRSVIPVVLAGMVTSAAASPDPVRTAVDRLPVIETVTRGRAKVVVRGELSRRQAKEVVAVVDQVVADVQARFTATAEAADPEVTLCALADDARFGAVASAFDHVPSNLGFYRADHRVALANLGRSIGNLRHELVHALIGDDYPDIPMWLNEGIAALYGSARHTRTGFELLVNYRLRDLQRALAGGRLPAFAALVRSTDDDVHGDDAAMWYGYARYVLLYADRRGTLPAMYRELRAAGVDGAAHERILATYVDEKAFRAWAKALRY